MECAFNVLLHRPFKVIAKSDGRPAVEVEVNGKAQAFGSEELSSMVLTKMKQTAEQYLGKPVK
jgi:molecular chaperone DnaK